ncbi:LysR family transcriptional regulator [Eoetvoesiella caeni]
MNLDNLDITTLRVFDTLIRTKHVTNTGMELGLSQPSVSFALNKLRTLTNDTLFVRTSQGMEPTPRAMKMSESIRLILNVMETEVFGQNTFDPLHSERSFTLCMSDIGEIVFLPQLIKLLDRAAPQVSIRTVSLPPNELENALMSGDVDLALGYYPDLTKANFFQQLLFSDTFVCMMRKDHKLAGRKLTMDAFEAASHIVVRAEGRSEEIFERFLEQRKLQRRVKLVIPHFMSIPHLLLGTDLIVTVPHSCAVSVVRSGPLTMQTLPMKSPKFELKQHWHARYHRDETSRWLRKIVHEAFSALFLPQ